LPSVGTCSSSKESGVVRLSCDSSPSRKWPLMRFVALQSIVCRAAADPLVSPRPRGVAVSSAPPGILRDRPPRPCGPGSSSHARRPLQSTSPPHSRTCRSPCTFHEVWLSIATSARGVHLSASFQPRLRSARSVSHALDGLLLHDPRRLVSSFCHV